MELSCTPGNGNPEKIPYVLGNGTSLYFRKQKPWKILLWIKLQDAALYGFDQPAFDVYTQSLTARLLTHMLKKSFKYVYLLDELKAAFHLLWTHIITHYIL